MMPEFWSTLSSHLPLTISSPQRLRLILLRFLEYVEELRRVAVLSAPAENVLSQIPLAHPSHFFTVKDLPSSIAEVGGYLFPFGVQNTRDVDEEGERSIVKVKGREVHGGEEFVNTALTTLNLYSLALAVCEAAPILLMGVTGP